MKAVAVWIALALSFVSIPSQGHVIETQGNKVTPLKNGAELNAKRLELINGANQFIYIKTFIINQDPTEYPVYNALCNRAVNGLDVRILVDDIGRRQGGNPINAKGSAFSIEWFRACGIKFEMFSPLSWGLVAVALYHQHDKVLVTENGAIIGGTNFSKAYSNHAQLSPEWYDYDIALQGPAVCGLHRLFVDSWIEVYQKEKKFFPPLTPGEYVINEMVSKSRNLDLRFSLTTLHRECVHPEEVGSALVTTIYNNPYFSKKRPFEDYLLNSLDEVVNKESDRSVRLYAPYFVPSKNVAEQLIWASNHGAFIRIITNSATSIDPEAFQAYVAMLLRARELLANGVQIYLWHPSGVKGSPLTRDNVFHKKGGCFAKLSCFIGSHNLDVRGDEYSSELMAVLYDKDFIASHIADFEDDLRYTQRLNLTLLDQLLKDSKITSTVMARAIGWAL